jgi:hypothetical protein
LIVLGEKFQFWSHPLQRYVGIAIARDRKQRKLHISQPEYISQVNPGRPKCPPSQTNWEKGRRKCFPIPRSFWSSTLSSASIATLYILRGGSGGSFCWKLKPLPCQSCSPNHLLHSRNP